MFIYSGVLLKVLRERGSDIDLLAGYSGIEERRFLEVVSEIGFNYTYGN